MLPADALDAEEGLPVDTIPPEPRNAHPVRVCPGCGAPSRSRAGFCLRCGTRLPDPSSLFLPIGIRTATSQDTTDDVVTPANDLATARTVPEHTQEDVASRDLASPIPKESSATLGSGAAPAQAAPLAIVQMDPQGLITSLNTVAERLFSIGEDESVGRPYTAVFGESLASRMLRLFLRASRASNQDQLQVISAKRADGTAVTLQATVKVQHDTQGGMIGFIFLAEELAVATPAPSSDITQAAGSTP
jgi:PAS domain S-box-containing protein